MADMDKVLKGLQDTLTVMEGMQTRHAAIMEDHSGWLREHDRAMAAMRKEDERARAEARGREERIDARIEKLAVDAREREERIDARIEKLVSAIGEFVRRSN